MQKILAVNPPQQTEPRLFFDNSFGYDQISEESGLLLYFKREAIRFRIAPLARQRPD
jgi:hypothetical protein